MRTTFVSTVSLWNSSKSTLDKLQANLLKANKELSTGRDADVGLKLGYKTGTTLSLRQDRAELDVLTDSNASTTLRLKSMTKVLDQLRSNADKLMNAFISTPLTPATIEVLKYQAQAGLTSLTTTLNSDVNGQFVFGGINSQEKPFNAYLGGAAPSAAKAAVDSAFSAAPPAGFGFPQSAAGVSTITPAEMDTFLNGAFANLFTGTNWQNWSNASSENIQSRISPLERVEVTANANDEAIQKLTMAYTMVFDLGIDRLSEKTREVLVNKVIETLSKAISGVTEIGARLGTVQEKLELANERMSLQKDIFEEKIAHLEAVDPAEAKIRVDQIMTQIQTSYSLTAQLKGLSLINYL
jgi:flagellar hook-associated protein 3 FlgL